MRQIKFRAWDGEKLRYPNLINTSDSPTPLTCYTTDKLEPGHFDAKELMQFTGLCDKNGKEIYEGDILKKSTGLPMTKPPKQKIVGHVKKVIFHEGAFVMRSSLTSKKYYLRSSVIRYYGFEVIGNIYENPELIK